MGDGLTEAADAVETAHGQFDSVAWVGNFRLARIDADEGAAAGFRETANGGDVRPGADFNADQAIDRRQPLLQALILEGSATINPAPVAEHQDVGPGQCSAVRAMRHFAD